MLGKLIRYDLKIQLKVLVWGYLFTMVLGVVSGIFYGLQEAFPEEALLGFIGGYTHLFCIFAVIILIVGTAIYVILYFRKNLLRDEGYLMHTLPVTATQLYISKLLTAFICIGLSVAVAYLSCAISVQDIRWGETLFAFSYVLIPVMGISFFASLCQFYVSLCIGYTWNLKAGSSMNRDLLSVLVYVILYLIIQLVSGALLSIWLIGYVSSPSFGMEGVMMTEADSIFAQMNGLLASIGICNFVIGVVLSVISVLRLKRHINLA